MDLELALEQRAQLEEFRCRYRTASFSEIDAQEQVRKVQP